MVSICIIPLIILGFGSYTQSKSILSKNLTVTSTQILTEIYNGLSDYFNGFSNLVSMTANNYDFINVDAGDNYKYVPSMLKDLKKVIKIYLMCIMELPLESLLDILTQKCLIDMTQLQDLGTNKL